MPKAGSTATSILAKLQQLDDGDVDECVFFFFGKSGRLAFVAAPEADYLRVSECQHQLQNSMLG